MTTPSINTTRFFRNLRRPVLLAFLLHYSLFLPADPIAIGLAQADSLPQVIDLPFDHLTIEDGLPHPSVLDIMQDDRGFLWIATLRGIVRYDGYEMTTYFPAAGDPDSIPVRDIPRLYQDHSGGIWVGLAYQAAKLFKYDPRIDEFIPHLYDPERGIEVIQAPVSVMHEDREGNLLVAIDGQGLLVVDIKKVEEGITPANLPYRLYRSADGHPDSLASIYLGRSIVTDDRGHYWLATDAGLCEFYPEEGRFKTYPFASDTIEGANACSHLFRDRSGRLWVGTYRDGLWEFDLGGRSFKRHLSHDPEDPFSLPPDRPVGSMTQDRDGRLWLNVYPTLYQFEPENDRLIKIEYQPKPGENKWILDHLTNLFTDYTGNIWIGAWNKGVFIHHPDRSAFRFFTYSSSQPGKINRPLVTSITEDRYKNIWLGTQDNGVLRWNRRNQTVQAPEVTPETTHLLPGNEIYHVGMGQNDYLWIGTPRGAVRLHLPSGGLRSFQGENFLFDHSLRSNNDAIVLKKWRSGFSLLTDEETAKMESPRPKDPIITNRLKSIWTIEEDKEHNLWLGINQAGLIRYDPERDTFEAFLPAYGVRDIHFDRKGRCWLATHSAGLKLFDRKSGKVIHLHPEEHVKIGLTHSIQEDEQGHLWLMTPTGLTEFDPENRKTLRQFPFRYWMSAEMRWFWDQEPFRSKSGELFFPSPSGLLYFHPDSVHIDSLPPKVALTSFSLSGKKLHPGPDTPLPQHISHLRNITLRHHENDIEIGYAGLHFKSPEENQYRFILENFEEEWYEAGKRLTATYTNLPPGEYTFRVQAANSDGVWNREGASLLITVLPPWYQTGWARVLFLLNGLALLYFGYRFLLSRQAARAEAYRLQELNRFQTRFYANITHEFRTPLTLIMGVSEKLQQRLGQEEQKDLSLIHRHGRRILRLVNQLLDLSKLEARHLSVEPLQADIIPFLKGVVASFGSAAQQKEIELELELETKTDELTMDFDPPKMQSILENLLSNAIKFTPPGGEIQVVIKLSEAAGEKPIAKTRNPKTLKGPYLQLIVSDTGPGIAPEALPNIFDRFYQVDDSATREAGRLRPDLRDGTAAPAEGTGIGLALVKELVHLLEGHIEVDSRIGEGTKFRVWLPIRQTAPLQKTVAPAAFPGDLNTTPVADETVPLYPAPDTVYQPLALIVEDNADMSDFIAGILSDQYRVQRAFDGKGGIEKAIALSPDIIVSDVMMPEKDGYELCRTLKTDERTSHIPIILLTARADQKDRLTGLNQGADAYLAKPFDRRELLVRLEQLTALRQKLRERYGQLSATGWEEETTDPEATFLHKVRRQILNNLDDPAFDLHALGRALNMGRTSLYKKVKALTGRSTALYIRAVRLHEGRKLLLETSLSVAEVAYRTGFSDPNYFSSCFKEEFGMTASALRGKGQ